MNQETITQKLNGIFPKSLVVFLFSFYAFNPIIETGLDPSYAFGLNYIFAHHIHFGTQVIYTYGPLGFLYFPQDIATNFFLAVVLVSALRFFFIYSFLKLGNVVNPKLGLLHTLLAFAVCSYIYLDFILVAAVTCCLLLHSIKRQNSSLIVVSILSVIALLIKSSFGLMCISIAFSYAVFDLYKTKNFDNFNRLIIPGLLFLLLIWLLLYHSLSGIYLYLYGTWQLSTGNSSAMILEVYNNWYLLFLFAVLFFSVPFLMKEKAVYLLYGISLLSLYSAWKYAFSREENYHLKFFLDYLLVFTALFIVAAKQFKPRITGVLLTALFVFFQSIKATGMYTVEEDISFSGIRNFTNWIFSSRTMLENARVASENNLQLKKLPKEVLDRVGKQSIDFYPWELTYAAANNLNWKPRPNLQSGAYTPWLDRNNANFISSKDGPQFYLWEMDKPNGGVDCFDGRYLLNDEPQSILALFNSYKSVYADSSIVLFQKTGKLAFPLLIEGSKGKIFWNKWLEVPEDSTGIIRLRLFVSSTNVGKIRKALYKDQTYYVDYKFEDASEKAIRIIPETAVNGLWISPFVTRIDQGLKGKKVSAIRFHCSKQNLVQETFSYQWQIITLAEKKQNSRNEKN